MKKPMFTPTDNDKAVMRRFLRALSDAGLSENIDLSNIEVGSRGFSITGLSLNEFSGFTNQIEDIARLAAVQRGMNHQQRGMDAVLQQSHQLPAGYTRARVVKSPRVHS